MNDCDNYKSYCEKKLKTLIGMLLWRKINDKYLQTTDNYTITVIDDDVRGEEMWLEATNDNTFQTKTGLGNCTKFIR